MKQQNNHNLPQCPGCGAQHWPASNGAGQFVWCGGYPAGEVKTDK